MKSDPRYKIDLNTYASKHYPVALYRRVRCRMFGHKWEHMESFETKEKAREYYDAIKDETSGVPVFLA